MTETFWGLLVAGGLVSLVHGLLPNHWLPFVLIGRSQGWTAARMVGVLAAAAAAHTAVAGAIAMVTLLVGVALAEVIEPFAHTLPALILGGTGLFYIVLDLRGGRHPHHHHEVHVEAGKGMSDKTAMVTLVLTLALSPCEAMVPVFVSASPTGDPVLLFGIVVLSGAISLALMTVLALLTWTGITRAGFGRLAHRERLVVGAILLVVGVASLFLAHGHEAGG
jgi:hypothetical protein